VQKLLVVVWSGNGEGMDSHVLDFNTVQEANDAYDAIVYQEGESQCINYEVTKLYKEPAPASNGEPAVL